MKICSQNGLITKTSFFVILAFLMMNACSDSKKSGDGDTAPVVPSSTDDNDDTKAEDDTSNTLDAAAFAEFKQKAIESCKANREVYFDQILYTGFDGTKGFETPVLTFITCTLPDEIYSTNFTDEQYDEMWKALDEATLITEEQIQVSFATPDVFQIKANSAGIEDGVYRAVVVPLAAGESEITITLGDKSASGKIIAKQYQAADVTAGLNIYNGTTAIAGVTACASCHQAEGGVDHSANLVGVCSDAELGTAITTSVYGNNDDGEMGSCTGYELTTPHNWTLDATQAAQVVAYLRSLPLEKEKPTADPAANQ